jgi:hypothetical protein
MDLPTMNKQNIKERIGSRVLTMTLIKANAKGIYTKSSYGSTDNKHTISRKELDQGFLP